MEGRTLFRIPFALHPVSAPAAFRDEDAASPPVFPFLPFRLAILYAALQRPYVFLFLLPFVLWAFRRKNRAAAILHLAVLLLALIVKGPIYDRFGVEKPSFTESLSIPLQQVARVVSEGRPLTEQQEALIGQVVDVSLIPEYYEPSISDPVKALVSYNNADYLESHKGEFFRLWAELGLSWPRDYAEAFIDQTKGYWFPDRASLTVNEGISPNELGLSWPHLLRGQIPVKISELLLKMPDFLPLYGLLWSIGAYTWAALFLFAFQFLYGQRRYLLVYLPSLGTILTLLLATPVSSDLRYAYPLILAAPLLLTVPLCFGARLSRSIPATGGRLPTERRILRNNRPVVFSRQNV